MQKCETISKSDKKTELNNIYTYKVCLYQYIAE